MKQIQAFELVLAKVFSSNFDFRIPQYQRPYAWSPEQAGQLLEDIVEAMDRDGDEPYFLGSLVLVKDPASPPAEVIDGQQRLTTLTILIAVLRDLAETDELQGTISQMLAEPGNIIQELEPKPRLALRSQDRDFFAIYVQTAGGLEGLLALKPDALKTDAQRMIQSNAALFSAALSAWSADQRLNLVRMLSNRTMLVVVNTPDFNSAHRIFSVMNARGLDLSPTDIFKADVIGDLSDDDSKEYGQKWETAEEELGREAFLELFLHLRTITTKVRARRELLKEFPEQVLKAYLPDARKEFVDSLLIPYADALRTLSLRNYESTAGAEHVNRWLTRLSRLDNYDWRPPALWALRHHADDPQWLDGFLRRLERLAAMMLICRTYTTPRVQRYLDLLTQLDQGAGHDAPAFILSDEEVADTMTRLSGDLYLDSRTRKYVLLRLEETLVANSGVTFEPKIITVEHVLPQNPADGSVWHDWFTKDERQQWTHKLANLLLLSRTKNAEAQNYDFAKKKEKYFTSKHGVTNFALTSQVLQHNEWTPGILALRQQQQLQRLATTWSLEVATDS